MSTAETTVLKPHFGSQDETASITSIDRQSPQEQSLRACVESTMDRYFRNLDGQAVNDVYEMVLAEIEAPLLEVVMKNTRQNQTKASEILGLNRGTLRKKLKQYGLL